MKTLIVIVILITELSASAGDYNKQVTEMSSRLGQSMEEADLKRVAVVDFTDLQGTVTELGRFLAEEFSVSLAGMNRGFEIIDRIHLSSIMREHKLGATGVFDPKTAKTLGKIAGVDALVTGTITPFGESVRITVKLLNVETAGVIGSSRGEIAKTSAIVNLLSATVARSTSASGTFNKFAHRGNTETYSENNFTLELNSCRRIGSKVEVLLTVINEDADKKFCFSRNYQGRNTKVLDNKGHTYVADYMSLGSQSTRSSYIDILLVDHTPTKGIFHFEGVPLGIDSFTLLIVECYADINGWKYFSAEFKNVKID